MNVDPTVTLAEWGETFTEWITLSGGSTQRGMVSVDEQAPKMAAAMVQIEPMTNRLIALIIRS